MKNQALVSLIICIVLHSIFSRVAAQPEWQPVSNLQYTMNVVGKVQIPDAGFAIDPSNIIGAFADQECRGIAQPIIGLDGLFFLSIGSNSSAGETISFKVYLAESDEIVDLNETIVYENMGEVGTFLEPFIFTYQNQAVFFTISATSGPNGTIAPSGNISVAAGQNQSFTITPDVGYNIDEVLVDGLNAGAVESYTFSNVATDHSIHVSFAIKTYNLLYAAGANGSLQGAATQTVSHGSSGTPVTAVPDPGFQFVSWSDGSTANPRTDVNVTGNISVTASFSSVVYTISASSGPNGTIAPSGNISVAAGQNQSFTITPDVGYNIDEVLVDGLNAGAVDSYTFSNVAADHSIHASFAIKTYNLLYAAGANGSLQGAATQTVNHGSSGTPVTAVPDPGFQFVSWSDGSTANPRTDVNVTGNISVTASFEIINGSPDWNPLPNLQYNMQVVGKILLDGGGFSNNPMDVLGAFVGDECRGVASPFDDSGLYFLTIGSNQASGENISFKAYLSESNQIIDLTESFIFENQAEVGTFLNPFIYTYGNAPLFFNIEATASAGGSINPQGIISVLQGQDQLFNINADPGFIIADVLVNGESLGAVESYTFQNIQQSHQIHATFNPIYFTLTYLAGPHGSIQGQAIQQVPHGGSGTAVTAIPATGYIFDQWSDGNTQNPRTDLNVTTDITVTALFKISTYTITASSSGNGNISPEGNITVDYGDDLTFTMMPAPNHQLSDVLINGQSIGNPTTYSFTNIMQDHTIHAIFEINSYSLNYTAGANGSLNGETNQTVTFGSDGTPVEAVPDFGYLFVSWSDGRTDNPRTDLNVTENINVTANFGQNILTITSSAGPNGIIAPSGQISVAEGGSQLFAVIPNNGYKIEDVTVDGESVGPVITYEFVNIAQNHTIHASFSPDVVTLTYLAGINGSIAGEAIQVIPFGGNGDPVEAIPAVGYQFTGWSDGIMTNPRTDFNVTSDLTVTAEFEPLQFTINASAGQGGSINPDGLLQFVYGDSQTFSINPDEGYDIADVLVDGESVGPVSFYSFEFITADHSISAIFTSRLYTILATSGENGSISPQGEILINHGMDATFTISPNTGYSIDDVLVDGQSVGKLTQYTFENVTMDHSIHATFSQSLYEVVLTSNNPSYGQVTGEGTYPFGTTVLVTAVPQTGHQFINWTENGDIVATTPNYEFNITEDRYLLAVFEPILFTLQTEVEGQGAVVKTPNKPAYTYNETVFIEAQPAPGWTFSHWTGDVGNTNTPTTFIIMDEDQSVTAHFVEISYSLNVSIIGGGTVSKNPDLAAYPPGTQVTLTAAPNPSWYFNNWMGAYNGFDNPVTITMNGNKSITARFEPLVVDQVNVNGPGSAFIPAAGEAANQVIYQAAVYNQFGQLMSNETVSWSIVPEDLTGVTISADGMLTITDAAATSDLLVVATSQSNPSVFGVKMVELVETQTTFTLELQVNQGGAVSLLGNTYTNGIHQLELDINSTVSLEAVANQGWSFAFWTGNVSDQTSPLTELTMDAPQTVSVHFTQNLFQLFTFTSGNGTVIKTPDLPGYTLNQPVILKAVPAAGWAFSHWTGNVANPSKASTFILMNGNQEVTAHFVQQPVVLTVHIVGNGIVNRDPDALEFMPGTTVNLEPIPQSGWIFSHWEGDVVNNAVFMDVSKAITAHFIPDSYVLTVAIEGSGAVSRNPDLPSYNYGQPVIVTASAAPGWQFSHWEGEVFNPNAVKTAVLMDNNKTIKAHFIQPGFTLDLSVIGNGTVSVSPEGPIYAPGTQVTLTATHNGQGFFYWLGSYVGFENPITITMNSNKNLKATFIDWAGGSSIMPMITPYVQQVTEGDFFITGAGQVLLPESGMPASNSQYQAWVSNESGQIIPTSEVVWSVTGPPGFPVIGITIDPVSGLLTVTSDAFLPVIGVRTTSIENPEVYQTKIVELVNELSAVSLHLWNVGSGQTSIDGTVYAEAFQSVELTPGQTYNLTATPNANFAFAGWSGDLNGTANPAQILMDSEKTIQVTFESIQYNLSTNVNGNGNVTRTPDQDFYNVNDVVILEATPALGWSFSHWTGNVANPAVALTSILMDGNQTVTAHFTQDQYTLSLLANGEGTLTAIPQKEFYIYGEQVLLTANPSQGSQFDGWSGQLTGNENPVFIVMNTNKQITANFSLIPAIPTSILIAGASEIIIPLTGAPSVMETFTAQISDQFGMLMPEEEVIWSLTGNIPNGVSLNQQGVLTVTSQATLGSIGVKATSVTDPSLSETRIINLLKYFNVNVSTANPEFGTVAGGGTYLFGSTAVVTASANLGYTFVSWNENNAVVSTNPEFSFEVYSNRNLNAVFQTMTYTITASAGTGGAIAPEGAVSVNYGGNQTFTITPDTGYEIANVLVDGVSVGAVGTYTFSNVTADHSIEASFSMLTYTITASAGTGGAIAPEGAVSVNYGGSQTFTITPDTGYEIADVLVDGVSVGAVGSYTFSNVIANHSIEASFSMLTYTITASAGTGGAIAPEGVVSVNYGGNQTFTITPDTGYEIANVLVDGVSVGAVGSYTFSNVTADHSIEASFSMLTYTITASAGTGGAIAPEGAVSVNYGGNQTFTITPDTGYEIADVLVDGVSVGAVGTYTFSNVTADHTIAASFSLMSYTITASAGENGSINPAGDVVVQHGEDLTFTFSPAEGYQVYAFWVDGDSIGQAESYTFTNVTANHSIYVSFTVIIGLEETDELSVQLFPNPTTEIVYIRLSTLPAAAKQYTYTLFDVTGKLVKQGEMRLETTAVQVGSLPAGNYFLRIHQNGLPMRNIKLIKQ